MSRRSERVRGLMPGQACSSCMNRRAPSERSWTIRGVHLVAMISAVAATEQLPSCVSFIVRFMARSLLAVRARSYRSQSDSLRPGVGPVEPLANGVCTPPALVDRPHDQGLPAPRVACREDARYRGREARCRQVPALVALGAEAVDQVLLRPEEPHREQDELSRAGLLRPGDEVERRTARVPLPDDPLHAAVALEARRGDREAALAALLERVRRAELHRPLRPGRQVVRARRRGLAEQLDLRHRRSALPVGVRHAVGTRVAPTDHDDVLARGRDRGLGCAVDDALPPGEVLHREMDAVEVTARHGQVARYARARGDDHGVVVGRELGDGEVDADLDAEAELHSLCHQLPDAALDELLLDLELRHAEAHESAGGLVALEDGHLLARTRKLLGAGEAGGAGADHGDPAPGADGCRERDDPAFRPRAVDDRELYLLDRDGVALVDLEHAGGLTR